ncbi:hypothetical protein [Bacillus massilinigeriensis]|uniref:hypothetical protein n=1 Tax=Bacillus mediterraneensis TaxID=1805474 RepID=UPI0008F97506|nr:hypothetical protein [Bacillus mediterraneensis]
MSELRSIFKQEFMKLQNIEGIKQSFIATNVDEIKKIFGYIFVINYLKNRAETKRYFGAEYNMTFSLLLESTFALLTGQCRSSLLLLRSAQEANFRFVLERERELMLRQDSTLSFESLDFRFIETKRKFTKDLQNSIDRGKFSDYYNSIERTYTLYNKLSGVVHSQSKNMPVMSVEYFSSLHKETIIDKQEFFNLFSATLNEMFLLTFFMLRESLKKWDSYVLFDLLIILYGKKRSQSLIKLIKTFEINNLEVE